MRYNLILLSVLVCIGSVESNLSFVAADESPDPIGRPDGFKDGKRKMAAIWFEDGKWNLRMTSRDNPGKKDERVIFKGSVRVEGDRLIREFQALDTAKKAKDADWYLPHKDGKGFDFQFATFGKTDGVNFKVGKEATSITFRLRIDGNDDPKQILIGKKNQNPEKADFTLPAQPK
jgi:hypothetical protein